MLHLNVWDILVAKQPSSEEWHIAIWFGSCTDLKGEYYKHNILCTMDSVYRVVYLLKPVYRFMLVYSFKVVNRLWQSLASMISWSLLSQYFCHFLAFSLTQLCLKEKCNIDYLQCLAQWLTFHLFPQRSWLKSTRMRCRTWQWWTNTASFQTQTL